MLHRYFVKLATFFTLFFAGLVVLAYFISSPVMIALIGFVILLSAFGSFYFLLFKPLQNAFETIEKLEAREKSEREATKQTFLHVSQSYPFIGTLFQKIYTLLGILTHLSENYSQSAGKNSIATAQLMFSIDTMSKKQKKKTNIASNEVPYTGIEDTIPVIFILAIISVLAYINYKKYKNIVEVK